VENRYNNQGLTDGPQGSGGLQVGPKGGKEEILETRRLMKKEASMGDLEIRARPRIPR
jgi:hypothetical protein